MEKKKKSYSKLKFFLYGIVFTVIMYLVLSQIIYGWNNPV